MKKLAVISLFTERAVVEQIVVRIPFRLLLIEMAHDARIIGYEGARRSLSPSSLLPARNEEGCGKVF